MVDLARRHGIPLTAPARTLVDLAATLDEKPLRRAVRQAQALHLTNVRRLAETIQRAGRRHGSRKLADIIATGPAPTRSELEDVVLALIVDAGLEHPKVNRPMTLDGRRVVPDFRWPDRDLILEADGAAWHDGPAAREHDRDRQALLEAHGQRVIRVTWQQAISRPVQTVERLRAAGAPAGRRTPAGG